MHSALRKDFSSIVFQLPLPKSATVLDLGSGDGFFAALLAESGAQVTALDNCEPYLRWAESRHSGKGIQFVLGDACALPLPDNSMDVVWSAHSMQSLPNLRRSLSEVRRVLKPCGKLAVLETDNLHSVMLPWPPDVELNIRRVEHACIESTDQYLGTYFPRLADWLLRQCGFHRIRSTHTLIERHGPPTPALRKYLSLHVRDTVLKVKHRLPSFALHRLRRSLSPESEEYVLSDKGFFLRSLQTLVLAERD